MNTIIVALLYTYMHCTLSQAGSTALIVASSGGQSGAVKALLAAGANKEATNRVGECSRGSYMHGGWVGTTVYQ